MFNYTSGASLNQYLFHTEPASRYQAEDTCVALGGHLATYQSLGEQFEAERGLVLLGALLPGYHRAYWLGLHIPQVMPQCLPGAPASAAQLRAALCRSHRLARLKACVLCKHRSTPTSGLPS